jgi:hypothetical protein
MLDAYVIIAAIPGAPQFTILGENKQFFEEWGRGTTLSEVLTIQIEDILKGRSS